MQVRVQGSWSEVPAEAWDALVGAGSPFLEHAFLWTLERTGCASPETGWTPRPVTVWDDQGRLVGGAPAWRKTHALGEFVYDQGWSEAARRAGIRYYPKLVVAAPFSPVTGERLLRATPSVTEPLLAGIAAAAEDCAGIHVLFDTPAESQQLAERGWFRRAQYQFHWKNEGYRTFDDFLSTFRSDTRNQIRRERRALSQLAITVETAPSPALLDTLHGFYSRTAGQFGPWGHVHLSAAAFRALGEVWGHRLQAVIARDGDQVVGGALNVRKGDRLYGRYWGAAAEIRYLHFEVCYYQAIAWAIAEGISVFEPGHGGEHKYRRGFVPTLTWSNHALAEPRLHAALAAHTAAEVAAVEAEATALAGQRR
jgi:predicted N-acyltransferase